MCSLWLWAERGAELTRILDLSQEVERQPAAIVPERPLDHPMQLLHPARHAEPETESEEAARGERAAARQGPSGFLYFSVDQGKILRIVPKN